MLVSELLGADLEFDYSTSDGTATAGSDYLPVSGRGVIAAGDRSATIEISVLGDTVPEADEVFHLHLSNPSAGLVVRR